MDVQLPESGKKPEVSLVEEHEQAEAEESLIDRVGFTTDLSTDHETFVG